MHYLLKTEPSEYSFAELMKDSPTVWDGVKNPAAVKNLRGMRPGDELIIYHTGHEKRAVGRAEVVSADAADPKSPRMTIRAGGALAKQVTLEEIKSRKIFADSPLIRMGRLSVVPLTAGQFQFLLGE